MTKFFKLVVDRRIPILIIFVIAAIISAFLRQFVAVDYDMANYLPPTTPSTVSLDVMKTEFTGGIPNARVMIKNIPVSKALEYKEKLKAIDGVTAVTWLDDAVDITEPLEAQDKQTVETYYKDGNALITVTLDDDKKIKAVAAIRNLIGDENSMTGSAVTTAIAAKSTVDEIKIITALAVLFVLAALIFTTTSFAEPLLILVGIGVAVIVNMGSNIIFGKVSFVTNAAGNILQLAVSLDYSVFLLHRFDECRKEISDPKEAMVAALTRSTTSVLSSGLTTVIGFIALCLMQFGIGPDLGLALAKGIFISLLSVFLFFPSLLVLTYKLIDKTQHRPLLPSFRKLGKLVGKTMVPLAVIFAVIIAPAYLSSTSNDYYYSASHIFGSNTQSGGDNEKVEKIFGKSDTYALLVHKGDPATETKLSSELKKLPQVTSVISYVDKAGAEVPTEYLDKDTLSQLESKNYSRMIVSVKAEYEGSETFKLVENIRSTADKYYPDKYYLAGQGVTTYDLMKTVNSDMVKVNLIAIFAVFIVLILALKSVSLPIILVLGIETAIWVNLSFPYFTDKPIFYIAYIIISSIQLGATVDYAILFTDRYKEFRLTRNKKDAVVTTVSTVSVSILTSASVLTVIGFLLGFISTHGVLSQLGILLGRGTLCSLVIVMFILPGLLYIFDGLIQKTTFLKDKFYKQKAGR